MYDKKAAALCSATDACSCHTIPLQAALRLQAMQRGRLARQQVNKLKEEQAAALAEAQAQEAAAVKMQCAWRARQSRKRVAALRAQHKEEQEAHARETVAIKLQCAWRARQARLKVGHTCKLVDTEEFTVTALEK